MPPHGLYNIGKYTYAPYKVVWKALASGMISTVISSKNFPGIGEKLLIPDHNLLMLPFQEEGEAHYLCGVLNSEIINEFVTSYISWFYSSHILEHINIPDFDGSNEKHIRISQISKQAHSLGKLGQKEQMNLNQLVEEILEKG